MSQPETPQVDAWCANCTAHIRECMCLSPFFVTKAQLDAGVQPQIAVPVPLSEGIRFSNGSVLRQRGGQPETPDLLQELARGARKKLEQEQLLARLLTPHGHDITESIIEAALHQAHQQGREVAEAEIAADPDRYKGFKQRIVLHAQQQREQLQPYLRCTDGCAIHKCMNCGHPLWLHDRADDLDEVTCIQQHLNFMPKICNCGCQDVLATLRSQETP